MIVSEQIASGIISFELRHTTLKKEIEDEVKSQKGVLLESYNQMLGPILNEVSVLLTKHLQAEK